MARSSSGIVAGLTAAALAAVGFLGYQASASAPAHPAAATKQPAASAAPSQPAAPQEPAKPGPVPADSGKGVRVVYSLSQKRIWLVGDAGVETKTFAVVPSTVHPKTGSYSVDTRQGSVVGSDGAAVEHIVRFATTDGVVIGFSARKDGALPEPDPTKKTGGIRMARADGDAVWNFATIGTRVVVVP
ncbi:hypothetical protein ABT084_24115 [Streptomyces sp. NPDC002138]|uniref:hypothetical protein n=1 Tax=Streptomyces sp. NPDC002138 TaxID=3154410 RepID=UPI003316A457